MVLTMCYLVIKKCELMILMKQKNLLHFNLDSPEGPRLVLTWVSFFVSIIGIFALVVARGHYSIDVLLAYFVTSRIWWIYHTLAAHKELKFKSNGNLISEAWWFYMFWYFEENVPTELD